MRILLAAVVLIAAVAYGKCTSLIPSPDDPGAFWIGNTAAPWLAMAFVAGAVQATAVAGMLAGAIVDLVIVAAFYSHFLTIPDDRQNGFSRLVSWIEFAGPWFLVALLGGAAYGFFGYYWRAKRSRLAAVLLGVPFVAETLVQRATDGQWPGSFGFFFGLAVFGVVIAALAWLVVRSPHCPNVPID